MFVIIKIIKNNTRILNTLFIAEFIEIMEQYFHYWNHNNLQCNSVAQTKDLYSCDAASTWIHIVIRRPFADEYPIGDDFSS